MKLSPGDLIGAYRIEALIGSGGMGQVYGARHTHLVDRFVAIKSLPEELATDRPALRRFRQEALAASRLAHPHICTIHDFIEDARGSFLVMEYLDGETLADRLVREQLDDDTICHTALDIANGLAHAHGKGIIHRDLKPANVMLTPNGAKILDFGLARDALRTVYAGADALSEPGDFTTPGGTMPYMAPEQFSSGRVDARADIYSLGVTIYEMLTGHRPYTANSTRALIASVLTGQPDPFADLPRRSSKLIAVVRRCMAVDPADRWSSAAEVATALRSASWGRTPMPSTGRRRGSRPVFGEHALVALIAVLLSIGGLALYLKIMSPSDPQAREFDLRPPPGVTLVNDLSGAAISPDGRTVLYSGSDSTGMVRLWLRPITRATTPAAAATAAVLPNSDRAHTPFWSPDGERLGYFVRDSLWISNLAGNAKRLTAVSLEARGASWGSDDIIVYAPGPHGGLRRISVTTGISVQLTSPDRNAGHIGHLWPHFLPDGSHFIYFVAADNDSAKGIYVASVQDPRGRRLTYATGNAAYADGYLLYYRDTELYARPFAVSALTFEGPEVLLRMDVAAASTYQVAFSVARTSGNNAGVLIYSAASAKTPSQLVALNTEGAQLTPLWRPEHLRGPNLSYDGTRVAFELYHGTDSDIAILDLPSGRLQRLSNPNTQASLPVWSPTRFQLAYVAEQAAGWGLYLWEPDRSTPPRQIYLSPQAILLGDWSLNDEIFFSSRGDSGYDVFALRLSAPSSPVGVLTGPGHQFGPDVSPSGARIAFMAVVRGDLQVFVEDYPSSGNRCQISAVGGYEPRWGTTDSTLFFLQASGDLMKTHVPDTSTCPRAAPSMLARTSVGNITTTPTHFAVNPRLGTFIMTIPRPGQHASEITLIENWKSLLTNPAR